MAARKYGSSSHRTTGTGGARMNGYFATIAPLWLEGIAHPHYFQTGPSTPQHSMQFRCHPYEETCGLPVHRQ
jgi:hypothetical protein